MLPVGISMERTAAGGEARRATLRRREKGGQPGLAPSRTLPRRVGEGRKKSPLVLVRSCGRTGNSGKKKAVCRGARKKVALSHKGERNGTIPTYYRVGKKAVLTFRGKRNDRPEGGRKISTEERDRGGHEGRKKELNKAPPLNLPIQKEKESPDLPQREKEASEKTIRVKGRKAEYVEHLEKNLRASSASIAL